MLLIITAVSLASSEVVLHELGKKIQQSLERAESPSDGGVVRSIIENKLLVIQRRDKTVVTLPAHIHLQRGRIRPGVYDAQAYLLEDVRVGDNVYLNTIKDGKVVSFVDIQISARPGGFVPPSRIPNSRPDLEWHKPYHERINKANADRAKIGILPDK